jgi:hypothetical protein
MSPSSGSARLEQLSATTTISATEYFRDLSEP